MTIYRHLILSVLASWHPLGAADAPSPTNHLAGEKSPYLLQHASNPVDWYPWGEAAFARAIKENKPVFLSVGYSTCHWCHVMARESFSDPAIATLMNENFINIKVDREERPDVDQVYMAFVQATTGSGGWPMSVWLTPELKPFVGGTYFPPKDANGMPGFQSVLQQLAKAWKEHEPEIRATAGEVTEQLRKMAAGAGIADDLPSIGSLDAAFNELTAAFDSEEGGFGSAPKFPRPVTLDFLHHYAVVKGVGSAAAIKALEMTGTTLRKMAAGGMHDHLGGGFHRYSVDRFWHIPHYEKMLYDQAQLASAYLDAARLGGRPEFHEIARDIFAYVSRRMTSPEGGFYSAEDADSLKFPTAAHKTEGAFYIWQKSQIDGLLGKDAALFETVYGVEAVGNAPDGSDPHGDLKGTNTLIRRLSDREAAAKFKLTADEVAAKLAAARKTLFESREKRPHPHLDDKILTAWNGLMISAYAKAYQELGDRAYLDAATKAARFIREKLYDPNRGVLLRSYRDGPAQIDGFTADYAFLIQGLLDLYEAGFDSESLAWADTLQTKQDALFLDSAGGGYFSSAGGDAHVLIRSKEAYDGAEPSENSISALNLLRLAAMLDQPQRAKTANRVLRAFAGQIGKSPTSVPKMLIALDAARGKSAQIVIAGRPGADDTAVLLEIVRHHARPHQVVLLADGGDAQKFLAGHADFYQSISRLDGKATAYVCENFVCHLPTHDPEKLRALLDAK